MTLKEKYKQIVYELNTYEDSVKVLNKQGLFDEARWFEELVKNCLNILYSEKFINLNNENSFYPGADLCNKELDIYIQVTTGNNIKRKVIDTFKTTNRNNLSCNKFIFVCLSKEEIPNFQQTLPKYFDPKKDIYNINRILALIKEKSDKIGEIYECFQKYFLKDFDFNKFNEQLRISENILKNGICSKINNKLEIERKSYVVEEFQYLLISGDAGYGKSVFAKSIALSGRTLYLRGEQFIESNIENIFGFDLFKVLEYVQINKNITIFIDSLESLSDTYQSDLLDYFMTKIEEFQNIKVIFTCRSSELSRFNKLMLKFNIKQIKLDALNRDEMLQVYNTFPSLLSINKTSKLYKILSVPLYLNLVLTYGVEHDQIKEENDFRNYIWDNIISKDSIQRDTFKKIVKDRASAFCISVPKDEYDISAVKNLVRNGVLFERDGQVRPKYDLFEDICFERQIDIYFEKSKADFDQFFTSIELLGDCVYRRYQIWVKNKLWNKENGEKFISKIIFANNNNVDKWKLQTIIGIINSKCADDFLVRNKEKFRDSNILKGFLKVMNLYGLDFKYYSLVEQTKLYPRIYGRIGLLKNIYELGFYKKQDCNKLVLKFIMDNIECGFERIESTRNITFEIMDYITCNEVDSYLKSTNYEFEPLFDFYKSMFIYSKDQTRRVTDKVDALLKMYSSEDRYKKKMGEKLICFCLDNENYGLVSLHPKVITELAIKFWTNINNPDNSIYSNFNDDFDESKRYGLNPCIDWVTDRRKDFRKCYFFKNLFYVNFEVGLDFTIKFSNYVIASLVRNRPEEVVNAIIHFDNEDKMYYSNKNLWLANSGKGNMNHLIIYLLENLEDSLIKKIEREQSDAKKIKIANDFKNKVYDKSNNICLFPIILKLGMLFFEHLGDFALELLSEISFIYFDYSRATLSNLSIYSMGHFNDSKNTRSKNNPIFSGKETIDQYMFGLQLYGYKDRCQILLDYLYTKDEIKTNKSMIFQVEKMDLRRAKFTQIDKGYIVFPGKILSDNSKKYEKELSNQKYTDNEGSEVLKKIKKEINVVNSNYSLIIKQIMNVILTSKNYLIPDFLDGDICYIFNIIIKKPKLLKIEEFNYIIGFMYEKILQSFDNKGLGCMLNDYSNLLLIDRSYLNITNKFLYKKIIFDSYTIEANSEAEKIRKLVNENFDLNFKKDIIIEIITKSKGIAQINKINFEKNNRKVDESCLNFRNICDKIEKEKIVLPTIKVIDDHIFCIPVLMNIFRFDITINNLWMKKFTTSFTKYIISSKSEKRHNYFDFYEFQKYLSDNMIESIDRGKEIVDIIIDSLFSVEISKGIIEFINTIFNMLTPKYINAYKFPENKKRILIENVIDYFEVSLREKFSTDICHNFSLSYLLCFEYYRFDPNTLYTKYSFEDKQYINNKYLKFGKFNSEKAIINLNYLKFEQLLPDIMPGLNNSIPNINIIYSSLKVRNTLLKIIEFCYFDTNIFKKIKNDADLTGAFVEILQKMGDCGISEALLILEEFRIL